MSDETVTIELDPADAQLVAGVLQSEAMRAAKSDEPAEHDDARETYERVRDTVIDDLNEQFDARIGEVTTGP